jgi:hypothetical protein
MVERAIIVLGGILSIYLGYRLFMHGITAAQGSARAFGIELRDFGPGLFFAALGAYVLVRALAATIRSGTAPQQDLAESGSTAPEESASGVQTPLAATFFFGAEDPSRQLDKWSAKSFFLETRDLLRKMDSEDSTSELEPIQIGLKEKLESITMTTQEYQRYQLLTNKADHTPEEQREFLELEGKLFP